MTEKRSVHAKPTPVKHVGKGRPVSEEQFQKFLDNYALTGLLGHSARAADMSPENVRRRRMADEEFAKACEEALQTYRETLEMEVHRRAVSGWDEPVYQKGEFVGTIRRYSDRLLELQVKRHIPEYRDKFSIAAEVKGGVMVVPATPGSMDDWEAQFGEKARGTTRHNGGSE